MIQAFVRAKSILRSLGASNKKQTVQDAELENFTPNEPSRFEYRDSDRRTRTQEGWSQGESTRKGAKRRRATSVGNIKAKTQGDAIQEGRIKDGI